MSVTSLDFQNTYTTDGVTATYPFTWTCISQNEVTAYLNGTALVLGTDFTVALNLIGIGGTITLLVTPPASETLLIQRVDDFLQPNNFGNNQAIPPQTLVQMFDKLTIMCQQLLTQASLSLALSLPAAAANVSGQLPFPIIPGALIGWSGPATSPEKPAYVAPHTAGWVLTDNGVGNLPSFQPSSGGGGGGGNMAGPTPPSVVGAVATYADVSARVLAASAVPVQAGYGLIDNGVGNAPTFQQIKNVTQHTSETVTSGGTSLGSTWTTVMSPAPAQAGTYLVICQSNVTISGGPGVFADLQIISGGTGGVTLANPITSDIEGLSGLTGDYVMIGVAILASNTSTLAVQAQQGVSGSATYNYGKCIMVRIA